MVTAILLVCIIIFPQLALFTDFYWWTLTAAFVLIVFTLNISVAREEGRAIFAVN